MSKINDPFEMDEFDALRHADEPDCEASRRCDDAADGGIPLPSALETATDLIVEDGLDDVITRIWDGEPLCVIVIAPTSDWCAPLEKAIHRRIRLRSALSTGVSTFVLARENAAIRDSNRAQDGAAVVSRLAEGDAVVAVSHAPEKCLPEIALRAADFTVRLGALTGAQLRHVIATVAGADPGEVSDTLAGGVGAQDIAACIRPGSEAGCAVRRLHAVLDARTRTRSITAPLLEDLAGYGEARDWGLRLARDVARYRAGTDGGEALRLEDFPRGLMLSGPPGVGKSLFAQALARSCGLPIIATSVSVWMSAGNLHEVIARMNADFAAAREFELAILFVDEIDAVVDPTHDGNHGRSWWLSFRSGLLSQIDSATSEPNLILLGACNHPDLVDAALKRSGRLDRHIPIPLPGAGDLEAILRLQLGTDLPDADLAPLAQLALGSSGADIARFVRDARALARDKSRSLLISDLQRTICPIDMRPPALLRRIALHEAGHAVVALMLGRDVEHVSLVGQGASEGHALIRMPRFIQRKTVEEEVTIALAGRAVDVRLGGGACAGSAADLTRATSLLASARFCGGLGPQLFTVADREEALRLATADPCVHAELEADLQRLWQRALALVNQHEAPIRSVAHILRHEQMLTRERLHQIVLVDGERRTSPPKHPRNT